ncbi:hypothetical protein RclHR1_31920001 [Rhizophagus clarus]|uniref:Concanavalin A-like lectin/glucanase domain-containing protein n=1 Tax=Rhizophagus clarus TaxID=94130 RepID=A0A2Z6S1Y7_9GLOM|nr:hypothetical protein RclHR1_31920001 [Rhizophagus clarus]GES84366.1 concanavalin A-like lectin/glucanase domain-containing protein [Rhizophagus clarus]
MTILKITDPYNTNITIGLATKPNPCFRIPGLNLYSINYHSINGKKFNNNNIGIEYRPEWKVEDIISCGYYSDSSEVFFTRNGDFLGEAFTGIKHIWFPIISANDSYVIKINFRNNPDNKFKYKEAIDYDFDKPILLSRRRRFKKN